MNLDLTRLEKIQHRGNKIHSRCPACAATGNDRTGNHLFINAMTGQFGCAAFQDDTEHRKEIFRLVGIVEERNTDFNLADWKESKRKAEQAKRERERMTRQAIRRRTEVIHKWQWNEPQADPMAAGEFITLMFPHDALVWTGETYQSGSKYGNRWRTAQDWCSAEDAGPMTTPSIWKPGISNRTAQNIELGLYEVLDFDCLPAESALAITNWIWKVMHWNLRAIIHTGNKSIHAWFDRPSPEAIQSLRDHAEVLGIDKSLIGHPEHPCRLPGMAHAKTGKLSRVLWLQYPPG